MGQKVGRPSVVTKDGKVLAKLIEGFKKGFSDELACQYADIHPSTYYRHMQSDESFAREIRSAKTFVTMAASKVMVDAIGKGNLRASKWWLDRAWRGQEKKESPSPAYHFSDTEIRGKYTNQRVYPNETGKQFVVNATPTILPKQPVVDKKLLLAKVEEQLKSIGERLNELSANQVSNRLNNPVSETI